MSKKTVSQHRRNVNRNLPKQRKRELSLDAMPMPAAQKCVARLCGSEHLAQGLLSVAPAKLQPVMSER